MTEVQFAKQFLTTLDAKPAKHQSEHVFDPQTFQTRIPYTLPRLSHPPHPPPPKSTPTNAPAPGSEPITESIPTPTIDITLKSTRNPTFTLHLPSLPLSTPITTLKAQVQSLLSGSTSPDKIKILHNKKPTPASKSTIHDVLSTDNTTTTSYPSTTEFGVMVMGGASDPSPNTQTINLNNTIETSTSTSANIPPAGPGSENATVEAATGINPDDVVMKGLEQTAQTQQRQEESKNPQSQPGQPGELRGRAVLSTQEFWNDLRGFLEQRLRDQEEARRVIRVFEVAAKPAGME